MISPHNNFMIIYIAPYITRVVSHKQINSPHLDGYRYSSFHERAAPQFSPRRPSSTEGVSTKGGQNLLAWSPPHLAQQCEKRQGIEEQGLPSFQAKQACALLLLGLGGTGKVDTGGVGRCMDSELSTMA